MKPYFLYTLILISIGSCFTKAKAQLNPLSSQYYNNPYLGNPAMAGTDSVFTLFVSHRKMFLNFPGSPVTQNLSATYGFKKVGLGVNIKTEKAALLRETSAKGTFSYHVLLNEAGNRLHFGLSVGLASQSLMDDQINGNPSDIVIGDYNNRETEFDGDFGVAYTANRFKIEAAIPNLGNILAKTKLRFSDVPTFYSALSYTIRVGDEDSKYGVGLEPRIVYRGVKGFDNMWDGGVQATFGKKQLCLSTLYHSNQSATFGLTLNVKSKYVISGLFNTNPKVLNGNARGRFEINLGLRL